MILKKCLIYIFLIILLNFIICFETSFEETPIQHVVIIIKENHSFDHYFGKFDRDADADPSLAGYDKDDIPNLWSLAENYILCDNFYSSFPGFSFPNHFYLITAWTPLSHNPKGDWKYAGYWPNRITLADILEEHNISWHVYSWRKWGPYFPLYTTHSRRILKGHWFPSDQFIDDVKKGILANVTWVTDTSEYTDHPPHNVTLSDWYTGEQVKAIMNSKYWKNTVIFIVEDDHGGFKDHKHILEPEYHDGIKQKWFRIPCIIVSPFVKKGYVSHEFYEFTSILKFIETIFGLPSINERDFLSGYFQDCFEIDLGKPPTRYLQNFGKGLYVFSLNISMPGNLYFYVNGSRYNDSILLSPSYYLVKVDKIFNFGNNSRLVFKSWIDGVNSSKRYIYLDKNIVLKPIYIRQYYLNVTSNYGKIYGLGWYSEDEEAHISVSPTYIHGFPFNRVFKYWIDDKGKIVSTKPSFTVIVDSPKHFYAVFEDELNLTVYIYVFLTIYLAAMIILIVRRLKVGI